MLILRKAGFANKKRELGKQMTKKTLIMRYDRKKVENSKSQDRKAGREMNEEEYITAEWCLNRLEKQMPKCLSPFKFEAKQGKLAQPLCNDCGHHLDHCRACCFYCNVNVH